MSAIQRRGSNAQRDTISNFICPDNGYRGKQARQGVQPKDHMKENMRELKQSQAVMREKKEEAARPAKELYKLSQFKDVGSKLYEAPERLTTRRPSLDHKEFLSKGVSEKRREELALESRAQRIELDKKMDEAKHYADLPTTPRKQSVPKSTDVAALAPPSNANFVSRNKVKAMTMIPARKESTDEPHRHEEYGRVPEYLEERKAQWADQEEEVRRKKPDPNCPPGMCLMPEDERVSTLETLMRSKEEALVQLRKLPFVVETPTMKKRQEYLDNKLREIDQAMAIFSKSKVYVASDR